MKAKRLETILDIITNEKVNGQDTLLSTLKDRGFTITQATLSRDLKQLRVSKTPTESGEYIYTILTETAPPTPPILDVTKGGSNTVEFSGHFAVVKTKPGYAGAIASDIDQFAREHTIGTIAGDDTILIIPRDGTTREQIISTLSRIIPNINVV
ncbi:MAG: arginine repressor [Bacteroidales bacterium]